MRTNDLAYVRARARQYRSFAGAGFGDAGGEIVKSLIGFIPVVGGLIGGAIDGGIKGGGAPYIEVDDPPVIRDPDTIKDTTWIIYGTSGLLFAVGLGAFYFLQKGR